MKNDDFSTENLLIILDKIKEKIVNQQIPLEFQQDLWNYLFWDKNNPQNRENITHMFVGWFIHEQIKANKRKMDNTIKS